jgi:hypothetical protein
VRSDEAELIDRHRERIGDGVVHLGCRLETAYGIHGERSLKQWCQSGVGELLLHRGVSRIGQGDDPQTDAAFALCR